MNRERLYLFDTTLRDGAQTNGVDFTLHDKQLIAQMLDELGIDYVEGGYPGANPTDTEFFARKPKLDHASFTAFGMTRRPGRSASNDPGLAALLEAKADAICFVAKSSAYQVRVALETTNEENLSSIRESLKAAKSAGREVMLDCEHFFDGYKEDPQFALACAKAAYDSGARWVVLCDALEKLAGGRGAKALTVDASDNAAEFFAKRGYVAKQRNTVTVNGEWLANTTMQKVLADGAAPGDPQ